VGELSAKDKKIEKEGKACLKRSQAHLKRNSAGWDENKALMLGRVKGGKNGISEGYGLFKSLVSNMFVSTPEVYFEGKKEEQRLIAGYISDATNYDFTIGHLYDAQLKSLWRCFPYGFGYIAEQVESVFGYDEKGEKSDVLVQRFGWRPIPNRDVLFDPDGFSYWFEDHRYQFIAHYKTISEIRNYKPQGNERGYFNLEFLEKLPKANEQTRPSPNRESAYISATGGPPAGDDENPDFRQVKLWRWYDRVNGKVCDFCDGDNRLIRVEDWPLPVQIQGLLQFPGKMMVLNPETDQFYPPSEVDLIKTQLTNMQRLNDRLMTGLTTKLEAYVGLSPYVTKESMGKLIDQKTGIKFILTSSIDMLAAAANAPKVDSAQDVVHRIQEIEPSQNLIPGLQECRNQIQNILGYGSPSRGGLPQIRSAKEASRVSDAMQKALLGRQTTLEHFTRELAMYHVLLLKAAVPPDSERYFKQTDKGIGLNSWMKYSPSAIPDEQDLFCDVYVGTSTPKSLDSKRAQFMQEVQVIGTWIKEMNLSPAPMAYRYAEIFGVRSIDQLFKNQRGAAMELMAAYIRMSQMGAETPPGLVDKAILQMVDAILPPAMKQQVIDSLSEEGGGAGGGGGQPNAPVADPFKQMGNPEGAVDMGSPA
jgi:hypothetical protein